MVPGPDPVTPGPAVPAPSVRRTRAAALGATLALGVIGRMWELWAAPTGRGTLALKVLPLAFALPGLWRYRLYTFRWLSLLVWAYVAEGVVRATSESGAGVPWAVAQTALALALFAACTRHVGARFAAGARRTAAG